MSYQILFNEQCSSPTIAIEYVPLCGKALATQCNKFQNSPRISLISLIIWSCCTHIREIKPLKLTVIEILGAQSPNHNLSIAKKSHQKNSEVFIFDMCRLHPIPLHGFDFLKTHTLLFHFAGGCCNGSNSCRGEPSCWMCSGRCAMLWKNDWSDFVQCLWSGFKGSNGNYWFCACFVQRLSTTKKTRTFNHIAEILLSLLLPSECILSFPFFRLSLHMAVSLFKKKKHPNVLSHGIKIATISDPWHPRWKWLWWKCFDTSHDVGVRQTALWDDLWSNHIHWTIETMPSWLQVLVNKNQGDVWLHGRIYKILFGFMLIL